MLASAQTGTTWGGRWFQTTAVSWRDCGARGETEWHIKWLNIINNTLKLVSFRMLLPFDEMELSHFLRTLQLLSLLPEDNSLIGSKMRRRWFQPRRPSFINNPLSLISSKGYHQLKVNSTNPELLYLLNATHHHLLCFFLPPWLIIITFSCKYHAHYVSVQPKH